MKLYSVQEVADLLHITRVTVYAYLKAKKINAVKIGKYWYVSEQNLNDFVNNGSGVIKNGVEQLDFGKYTLAEVENDQKQKREDYTNSLTAKLYSLVQLIQETLVKNSSLLQLNDGDKNALGSICQFIYSKIELINNEGKNTTYTGKDHAHILNLNRIERKYIHELCSKWVEENQNLEHDYDNEAGQEKFLDIDMLRRYTREEH